MSKSCLITPDIIGAVKWAKTAPSSVIKPEKGGNGITTWKTQALKDLKSKLLRERGTFPEAARRGVQFEKQVYASAMSGAIPENASEHFRQVVEECIGGDIQAKAGKEYIVDGERCYLYGKFDIAFEKITKDIKTTADYSADKYIGSIQHTLYAFVREVYLFRYIVAEWDEYPKIKKVHTINLELDPVLCKQILTKAIQDTFDFLKQNRFWEIYRETYCLY